MGELVYLFDKQPMTPEHRLHLRLRLADLSIEIALLQSERERLQTILNEGVEAK